MARNSLEVEMAHTPDAALAVETHRLAANGEIPNNPALPLLVYRGVLPLEGDPAAQCEQIFAGNGWPPAWRDGIYPYHHYPATAHEALGIVRGRARVRFGGAGGPVVEVSAGDVVVIPAGVGHKKESASDDLLVVGAYPDGRDEPDIRRGEPGERAAAAADVARVPLPAADPVAGMAGPLMGAWRGGPA
jgi:uncharacterized protein YjlB